MKQSPTGKGPYIYSDDYKMKVCNCPLHNGELVPIEKFWTFKDGKRKGLLLSRCIDGERISNKRDPKLSGFVPYARVHFVFKELEFRIGRAETMRRCGISPNFWWRVVDHKRQANIRKRTVIKAISVLKEVRATNEARHRDSIRHGSAFRGRKEKIPRNNKDFNGPDDTEAARSRTRRKQPPHLTRAG